MADGRHDPGAAGAGAPISREQRRIADAMPQLVWTCAPDGSCEYLSRRWVEYTGIPEAPQLGFGWLDRIHPDDRERTLVAWREAVSAGRMLDTQLRLQRHDGGYRWFRAVALPMPEETAPVTRWVGTCTDIEDHRRADDERERLLERAQRYAREVEAILSAHADALVIYGPDGEIRMMNPAAREMFDLDEGERVSYRDVIMNLRPVDARGDPIDLDELPSRRALRGERVRGLVVGMHTRKGLAWQSASAAPLRAPDGTIAGAVISGVDITHLRRLQEEREQMIRALTHDARTRLNVIRTHGEILGRPDTTAGDARRRGGIIVASSRRLAETIDALVGEP